MLLEIRDCSGDEREAAGCSVCGRRRGREGGGTSGRAQGKKNGGWRRSKRVDLFLTIYRNVKKQYSDNLNSLHDCSRSLEEKNNKKNNKKSSFCALKGKSRPKREKQNGRGKILAPKWMLLIWKDVKTKERSFDRFKDLAFPFETRKEEGGGGKTEDCRLRIQARGCMSFKSTQCT